MKSFIISFFMMIVISSSVSYAHCLECNDYTVMQPIHYSVFQLNCGQCGYTVYYSQCNTDQSKYLIDKIVADPVPPNQLCCQGTAVNDPIASGMILDEAANQIANGGTVTIYTPSRYWKWEGTVGPEGIHNAVIVPCNENESCCIYTYENGNLTSKIGFGNVENCYNAIPACMPLCD